MSRCLAFLRHLQASGDTFLFVRILLFAALVPPLYRFRLSTVAALVDPGVAPRPVEPAEVQKIQRYVRVAQRFGRPLVRPGCLTRGTTLFYFLRRAGCDLHLCFGMGVCHGEFAGHCWLERDGTPFLESTDPHPHFKEIFRIPGGSVAAPAAGGGTTGRLTATSELA